MICKNCGNNVPYGTKFCNRCGAPAETAPQPQYTPAQDFGGGYGAAAGGSSNKLIWTGVMVALAMLCIVALICSGIGINVKQNGMNISASAPLLPLAGNMTAIMPLMSSLYMVAGSASGAITAITVCSVIYIILAVVCCILYVISMAMTLKGKSSGIIAGLAASALTALLAIIMIIVVFVMASKLQIPASSGGIHPSFWMWMSLIIALLNGVYLAVKGREIIS